MAANKNSKLKLLCIQRMLEEETDADHGLSMAEIIQRLAEEGIAAERKSIYRDLEILREFGLDIKTYQRNPVEYAIEHRDFTLSELMLMVDAVASSKFLTVRQANILLANIKSLASLSQQQKLDRSIHVEGRIRSKQSVFSKRLISFIVLFENEKRSLFNTFTTVSMENVIQHMEVDGML